MLRLCVLGLAALCLVPPALAATHVVTQVGTTFSPDHLVILVGDTVRWEWSDGVHTVTSGTGAADPDSGLLFDALLYSAAPVFEVTFPEVGWVDYYCQPHESFGMTGSIFVEAPTPTEESTWGRVKRLFEEPSGTR